MISALHSFYLQHPYWFTASTMIPAFLAGAALSAVALKWEPFKIITDKAGSLIDTAQKQHSGSREKSAWEPIFGNKASTPADVAMPKTEPANAPQCGALPTMPSGSMAAAPYPPVGDPTEMLLGMVDLLDEIDALQPEADAEQRKALAHVAGRLRDQIELAQGEVIQEQAWNPALQRAVKVEPASTGQREPRLLESFASGLKYKGRIVRKQEVKISQPAAS
jgi:hypothetical protein